MKDIYTFKFWKHKYGPELLVDIVDYSAMLPAIRKHSVFKETFYSVTLVLDADELVSVNGISHIIGPGTIVTSVPGEVWDFSKDSRLKGFNLAFEREFLLNFFHDQHFLDRFAFLSPDRPNPFLEADKPLFERILGLYKEMKAEIDREDSIDQHILRAMLYETLMLLSRTSFIEASDAALLDDEMTPSRYSDAFVRLVADNFREHHDTSYYAERLFITPGYLNKITHSTLNKSAKEYIQAVIYDEACRLLRYTDGSVEEISEDLGFESSTYFVRSFRKRFDITPLQFRLEKK